MVKAFIQKQVESLTRKVFNFHCDPVQAMRLEALASTVAYIKSHAKDALALRTRDKLLALAVDRCPAEGLVAEVGVYRGESLNFIAKRLPARTVYGFDSFEGLPEDWTGWDLARGAFDLRGGLPRVRGNVTLVKGWFTETLPSFLAQHQQPVALLHVDCDIYSSTKCVFEQFGPRLRTGSIIVFDEYFNYVNWESHEFKAFQEAVATLRLRYHYLAYSTRQVAVVID